jgi:hypothetical protein
MATKKNAPRFPKQIHVFAADDDGRSEPYLVIDDGTDSRDGQRVAVYELKDVKTKRVTHSLE